MLLVYEVTRDFPTKLVEIETPIERTSTPMMRGKKPVLISVLRAGEGMIHGMLQTLPAAKVGHVGIARNPMNLQAEEYFFKMPSAMGERDAIVVDPMLATGNSAIAAIDRVKECAPRSLRFLCLLAAPEGIEALTKAHPDVPIFTPAVDEKLNEKGYIVPGLGDAGDRIFGTD